MLKSGVALSKKINMTVTIEMSKQHLMHKILFETWTIQINLIDLAIQNAPWPHKTIYEIRSYKS